MFCQFVHLLTTFHSADACSGKCLYRDYRLGFMEKKKEASSATGEQVADFHSSLLAKVISRYMMG
jgi:hypothetical protein